MKYQTQELDKMSNATDDEFFHCSWLIMHDWEAISKTRASCFIGVSKHSKTIKALGLRPRAYNSFLVFENPDESLTLVFEILCKKLQIKVDYSSELRF